MNQLLCGEALKALAGLPADLVDAIVTDPPYSSGGQFRGDRTGDPVAKYLAGGAEYVSFPGDNRDQRGQLAWMTLWLTECYRVAKPGAPIVMFTDWRQLPLMTDALQAGGFTWRGVAVWNKVAGFRPSKGRFASQCEYMIWGSKAAMPLERAVACLPGVFHHQVRKADKHHPTGKPTQLMRDVVKICEPGGLILDPFCGSGTTLVAAALEGYRYLGIELTEHYAAVARDRLATVAAAQTP